MSRRDDAGEGMGQRVEQGHDGLLEVVRDGRAELAQASVRPVREPEGRAGGAWDRSAGRAASARRGDHAPAVRRRTRASAPGPGRRVQVAAARASSTSDRTTGSDAAQGEAPDTTRSHQRGDGPHGRCYAAPHGARCVRRRRARPRVTLTSRPAASATQEGPRRLRGGRAAWLLARLRGQPLGPARFALAAVTTRTRQRRPPDGRACHPLGRTGPGRRPASGAATVSGVW